MLAILVQTYGFKYEVIDRESLKEVAGTNAAWAQSADHAVRAEVSQQVRTICSLRNGNDTKAKLVTASLTFQVVAIFLLSVSVGFELYGRP